jgi:VIT1/CCC1 family predicted Fe2+/Mn2+ transporter
MKLALLKRPAVFGAADGVAIALGLIVSLAGQPHALFHAALGAGLAELVGMTAGQWLSDRAAGFAAALTNGGAAFLACFAPALPCLSGSGGAAVTAASGALVAAVAAVISWLRPEKGVLAVAQTYGVLAGAAALCYAASLI